jgi:hypothetical protein
MAEVRDSSTNLTAGPDDMSAFYAEVCAIRTRFCRTHFHGFTQPTDLLYPR